MKKWNVMWSTGTQAEKLRDRTLEGDQPSKDEKVAQDRV